MAYFRGIFDEVAREFPDISTDRIYVDAAALYLVERPHTFDVIVTENMFGDILSDLAAGLVGRHGDGRLPPTSATASRSSSRRTDRRRRSPAAASRTRWRRFSRSR